MDPIYWVLLVALVIAAFVIGGVAVWMLMKRGSGHRLKERFGPEYDRIAKETGDHKKAEHELLRREHRVAQFDIRRLSSEERADYADRWRRVQAAFVDTPDRAVAEADELVGAVMRARGYPVSDFEQRAEDLSVDHAEVVQNYRAGHTLALRSGRGEAQTEDLRQAMVHYRALFEELLEAPVTDGESHRNHVKEVRR